MAEDTKAPPAPKPLKLVSKETGKVEEVPYAEARDALLSGRYGLEKGAELPVVTGTGVAGTVPLSELPNVVQGGGQIATSQEWERAQKEEKYKGAGYGAAAFGLGAADTLTFGLAPAAVQAAGSAVGALEPGQLKDVEEAHPYAHGAGMVAGLVAPVAAEALSGGTATPLVAPSLLRGAEAVEALSGAAKAAEGAGLFTRAITAPTRAVGAVGNLAENAVAKIVGRGAEGFAARTAQKAALTGARMAGEGGAVGLAQGFSDEMLSHEPGVSAERVLQHGLYGALLGGGLGTAVGAATPALSKVAERVGPWAAKKVIGEGAKALEADLGREGVRKLSAQMVADGLIEAGDKGLTRAAGTEDALFQKIANAEKAAVKARNDYVRGLAPEVAGAADIPGQEILADTAKALGRIPEYADPAVKRAQQVLMDRVGLSAGSDARAAEELRELSRRAKSAGIFDQVEPELDKAAVAQSKYAEALQKGSVEEQVQARLEYLRARGSAEKAAAALDPKTFQVRARGELSLNDAVDISEALTEQVSALERAGNVRGYEALSQLQKSLDERISKGVDRAFSTRIPGDGPYSKMGQASLDSARARMAELTERARLYTAASDAAHRTLNVSRGVEKAAAAGTSALDLAAVAGLASHGAGLGSYAAYAGAKWAVKQAAKAVQERAASAAAVTAERLAAVEQVERAARVVRRKLDEKVVDVVEHSLKAASRDFPAEYSVAKGLVGKTLGETFEERARNVLKLAAAEEGVLPQHVDAALGGGREFIPQVRNLVEAQAIGTLSYLVQTMPKEQESGVPGVPPLPIPDQKKSEWVQRYETVVDPISSLDSLKSGTFSPAQRETWQAAHPDLYQTTLTAFKAEQSKRAKKGAAKSAAQGSAQFPVSTSFAMEMKQLDGVIKAFEGKSTLSPSVGKALISIGGGGGGAKEPEMGTPDFGSNRRARTGRIGDTFSSAMKSGFGNRAK